MSGITFNLRFTETKRPRIADVPTAIARGLNEGGDRVRTQVQRALKQQTGVKAYSSITKRIRTNGAAAGRLAYVIHAMGPGIPIKEFPVKASAHGPVTANVWATPHTFKRSFKSSVRGLLLARKSDDKYAEIRVLYGPNLAKELHQGIVPAVFLHSAQLFVPPAIMRSLAKVFS